jgi:hypothetical protein
VSLYYVEKALSIKETITMGKCEVKDLKNLGYLNTWHLNPPEEVVKCRKLNHIRDWHRIDACVDEVECRKCGYKYKIDSGD